mgnify:FL=1
MLKGSSVLWNHHRLRVVRCRFCFDGATAHGGEKSHRNRMAKSTMVCRRSMGCPSCRAMRAGSLVATIIGVLLVSHGEANTVDLATLLMLGGLIASPFGTFSTIGQDMTRPRRALRDIQRIIHHDHDLVHCSGEITLGRRMTLRNVSVKAGDTQILKSVNLDLIKGTKVAVVGASGSGKSLSFGC